MTCRDVCFFLPLAALAVMPLGAGCTSIHTVGTGGSAGASHDAGRSGHDAGTGQESVVCAAHFTAKDAGLPATITVDSTTVLSSFVPKLVFGANSAWYFTPQDSTNTQPFVQAAGNYFIRYPGGSTSDDHHWNGTGNYDTNNAWVPSSTTYTPGFAGTETYRGTTSASYGTPATITDGDPTTRWLSNVDTASPTSQWVYVDFGFRDHGEPLQIVWATPYATSFQVQTWSEPSSWPPPYQALTTGGTWQTTSAGTVTGTGGTQSVSFTAVSTEFIRVLMTAENSAGANGAYSIAGSPLTMTRPRSRTTWLA